MDANPVHDFACITDVKHLQFMAITLSHNMLLS